MESLPFFVEPAPFLWAHCTRRSPRPWRLGTTDLFPPPRTRLFPLNMAVVPCPELPAPTRASNFVCPLCFAFDHQVLKRLIHFWWEFPNVTFQIQMSNFKGALHRKWLWLWDFIERRVFYTRWWGSQKSCLKSRNFHFHFQRPAKKNNGETEAMEAVSGRTSRTTTVSVRQLEVQAGGPDDRQWRWRCRRRDRGEHKRRRCSRRRKGRDITMRCWW